MTSKEWKTYKLSDFMEFNPRETLTKGTIAKKIAMENLQPFCRDVCQYEYAPYNGGVKFKNGDTIMARITPCLENGKTSKVNILEDNEIAFGSTEYIVFRKRDNISDENFIYYLVTSPKIREIAIKSMVGSSGRQRVQADVLANLELELPPLETQEKIARVLSSLDDKIELNNKINQNLEQQAQAIFKSWFVDFEPFGGKMPDDWRIGNLNDLSKEIICGKTPSTKNKEFYGKDVPFITIPDMHGNVFVINTERYLSTIGANTQNNKFLPPNSICVSCIATAGLVSITSVVSQTNQQINSIIPSNNNWVYYIYLYLKNLSKHIQMLGSSGSTTCNLNKGQFSKINILCPNKNVINDFYNIVFPIFSQILINQQENINLTQLRDTLLPKLMSGEIDVDKI